ncbi:MAG: hypothetical protein NVSMB10_03180 [Steroidobacteraceae bacterium]
MQAKLSICRRPLVVRCGAFGDMILLTVLIRALAAQFASEVDIVTSGSWSESLLRGQAGVGDIWCVRSRKSPYWLSRDQQRVVRRLRARGAGPTWYCDSNDAAAGMLARAGIDASFIVDVRRHPLLPGEHTTEYWQRLARVMPADVRCLPGPGTPLAAAGGGCYLTVDDAQRNDLDAWLRARGLQGAPLIAIQMGNKRTMRRGLRRLAINSKYWPAERWAAVLRHLRARHPRHLIMLLGTGPEFRLNEAMVALNLGNVHNAADDLPVPRLIALLERAEGLISIDSGPAHAGAAVGCPQVVLFGKASTSLYRPWGLAGAPVRILTGHIGNEATLLGIDAEQVKAAWDSLPLRGG